MSTHGNKKDRASMPKWLPNHLKDQCILTNRGWELRALGNNNPASFELIVAIGGNAIDGDVNDAPTAKRTGGQVVNQTIYGISGAAILPVVFEVFDLESINTNMTLAIDGNFPAGLTTAIGGRSDYEFVIIGTPTVSASTATTIIIGDEAGATVGLTFNVDITA